MMTPAIRALASMDPSGKVDICMPSGWCDSREDSFLDIFGKTPFINNVIRYPKEEFKIDYKIWYYTGHGEYSEAFEIFKKRSKVLYQAPAWQDVPIHEVNWYMQHIRDLGYTGTLPSQYVPTSSIALNYDTTSLQIGICNGTYSNKMKAAKQWPHFKELVYLLKNYYDCTVVKVGYQEELEEVEADIDYVGKLSFTETAGVIADLDLFITTDTALMHVGDALNINMIALFGGTLVSKNGALSKNAINLALGLPCQPCQRRPSFYDCENYNCIAGLTPDYVMAAVRSKLRR